MLDTSDDSFKCEFCPGGLEKSDLQVFEQRNNQLRKMAESLTHIP